MRFYLTKTIIHQKGKFVNIVELHEIIFFRLPIIIVEVRKNIGRVLL